MTIRLHALLVLVALVVLATGACVTTTAHRLPIKDNPMSQQAIACEARCHELLRPPAAQDCRSTPDSFRETCRDSAEAGGDAYAACLDHCPGATAIDGASCDRNPDAICRETSKPNWGGIAGGAAGGVAVGTVVLAAAVIGGAVATPLLIIILLTGT